MMQTLNIASLGGIARTLIFIFLMNGCGGGGGGGSPDTGPVGGWISITNPADTGRYSTSCGSVSLGGNAFISQNYYHCCSGSASDTGVTVSWENLVTGSSGAAQQSPEYCYLFGVQNLCDHTWYADIPLALGDNIIKVTAIDPGGSGGTDTITVNKPALSYTVSGALTSYGGIGLDIYRSGVSVDLKDETGTMLIRTSGGGVSGQFALPCVTNGNYLLEPASAPFSHSFDPAWYTVSVADSDVSGLDFRSVAYSADGNITYATNGAPVTGIQVEISDGSATFSRFLLQDGSYTYVVPAGNYTITPIPLCTGCTFTPQSRTVDLSFSSQSGLNFIYNTQ
jgi:hypothetical protein